MVLEIGDAREGIVGVGVARAPPTKWMLIMIVSERIAGIAGVLMATRRAIYLGSGDHG